MRCFDKGESGAGADGVTSLQLELVTKLHVGDWVTKP